MSGLLLRGIAHLATFDADDRELHGADLRIAGGRIAEIGHLAPASGEEVLDASGLLVLPGLINAHQHLYQVGLHTHLYEQTDTEFCHQRYGRTPWEIIGEAGWHRETTWLERRACPTPSESPRASLGRAGRGPRLRDRPGSGRTCSKMSCYRSWAHTSHH